MENNHSRGLPMGVRLLSPTSGYQPRGPGIRRRSPQSTSCDGLQGYLQELYRAGENRNSASEGVYKVSHALGPGENHRVGARPICGSWGTPREAVDGCGLLWGKNTGGRGPRTIHWHEPSWRAPFSQWDLAPQQPLDSRAGCLRPNTQ